MTDVICAEEVPVFKMTTATLIVSPADAVVDDGKTWAEIGEAAKALGAAMAIAIGSRRRGLRSNAIECDFAPLSLGTT